MPRHTRRPLAAALAAIVCLALAVPSARADERFTPVRDSLTSKECGACHMAFQPAMLPKRSWNRIMDGLANHFGEDASLKPEAERVIRAYLVANAADSGWLAGRFLRGLDDGATPLRITETPHWRREHEEEIRPSIWRDPRVRSRANCPACHRAAARGRYEIDDD